MRPFAFGSNPQRPGVPRRSASATQGCSSASRVSALGPDSCKLLNVQTLRLILKYLFAILSLFSGFNHFINTAFYVSIMPPYLPWHRQLVYLSGVLEIVLGVLLLAVFPANIHMAINHHLYPDYNVAALWLRLPLQFVLIAWAYWYTRTANQMAVAK